MKPRSPNPADRYRVLLFRRNLTELLLETQGPGFNLPQIEIPAHARIAEGCNEAARERWGLWTYCLRTRTIKRDRESVAYVVMEACGAGSAMPPALLWTRVEGLDGDAFADPHDFSFLGEYLKEAAQDHAQQGFFSKPGSLGAISEWVEGQTAAAGLRLTGEFRQLNGGSHFSLIRFQTSGSAVWFKAVGEPNVREFRITTTLESLFPGYMPRLAGMRPDWNAWLMTEAPGRHLDGGSPFEMWRIAAAALAGLQIASLGQPLNLIDAGCRDLRAYQLHAAVRPFIELISQLMRGQTAVLPAPLSREELRTLGEQIEEAVTALEGSQILNALGHLDPNPANLLVHNDSCVFLDWAEAFVGHPFLTLAYLLEHSRRLHGPEGDWGASLVKAYAGRWRCYFDDEQIKRALSVAPLVAAFAYAVSLCGANLPSQSYPHGTVKELRSLARLMKREADLAKERRSVCAF